MTDLTTEVLVLGGGPGGYTAAFRAADLGKKVILVERDPVLGGVCLNVGCIPSKALLHLAGIVQESKAFAAHGVSFGQPEFDLKKLAAWKNSVTQTLNKGLDGLVKQRKITRIQGEGRFTGTHQLTVEQNGQTQTIGFDNAIIATGSQPVKIPGFPHDDPRVWDSTDALELKQIPGRLLIVGGGIIGLEMATVYHALGSEISVVELQNQIIPGCDADLVRPLYLKIKKQYQNIWLNTKVAAMTAEKDAIKVGFEGEDAPENAEFDAVLVAVGRKPNGALIGADQAGVTVDERGFIPVDQQQRTSSAHIYAIGDIVGNPMLAHKAVYEGKIAAEVIAGHKAANDALTIPSVAYTDPEVAWMGVTETDAKAKGIAYDKGVFPWAASGRSLSMGRNEGMTKVLTDKNTGRIIGTGIVGPHAGDLIAEAVLALEMGAEAEDVALTIHPHPTLSETFAFANEMITGSITDLLPPKR